MEKLYLALLLLSMVVANFGFPTETVTHLHFFMQETVNSPNATNRIVAQAPNTLQSPTFFGLVTVLDNPLKTGPNNNSAIIGQMQGLTSFASLEEFSLHMTVDLLFTSGQYNGSVLSVVGRNPYMRPLRELAVVGGFGAFQYARGVFLIKTFLANTPPNTNTFEINVTVLHRVAHS